MRSLTPASKAAEKSVLPHFLVFWSKPINFVGIARENLSRMTADFQMASFARGSRCVGAMLEAPMFLRGSGVLAFALGCLSTEVLLVLSW
jgi:hypothetical protein